ncbi:gustatory receptor for bitter taste 66a-like [Bradysia coprophila]|uniref:gustatory receptor for bitter taste 66a-like n=1 Tax=Bradysia coprophila TaxID=38358 RepID=UPI00187D901A|nr:gustatory receptor for bitter taste 66a-like [Bradysia coprophila]
MIGISLMYMEPIMLVIDVGGFMINQKKLVACTTTLQELDDKLKKENIIIDYRKIRRITVTLIVVVSIFESGIMAYNYIQLEDSFWFAPLYVSTISKIWYVGLVYNVKQKFVAINLHLENMQRKFNDNKRKIKASYDKGKRLDSDQIGYLHREIVVKKNKANRTYATKRKPDILQVQSRNTWTGELYGSHKFQQTIKENDVHTVVGDKLDKKLLVLTQLHFEIAEISKTVNQMFSFQMLFLMAYGFMAITARIYFVYTGLAGQSIPVEFRSAQSAPVSIIFIAYTGAKCATVIMLSWKTKIDGQKTGVYIHKVATAVDEDHCYQTVNHLSLKLMNHWINFTACGFFELDMATLYAITGAVTSYIIILIQFNLAYQRTRSAGGNETLVNSTNLTNASNA